MTNHLGRIAAATALALSGTLTACASAADATGPIKIGAVTSLTGPVPLPEVTAAAKAVFDRVNANGGIGGRKIEYIVEDDKGDPGLASQAARRLVDEEGVVVNGGSASLVECSANSAFYIKSRIGDIPGTGIDPACFNSPNISPVNTGPFEGYTALLTYASEDLQATNVCAIILGLTGLTEGYEAAVGRWSDITGKQAALVDTSVTFGDDPTPAILAAKRADCDAVVFNATEAVTLSFMKAVDQQGMLDSADWLTLTSAYTEAEVKGLKKQNTLGLYVNSEFEPFTGDSVELKDWDDLLTDADVPLTSLSMGGYLAATIIVDTLESIDGDITRQSVMDALHGLNSYESDLMGTPYSFGEAKAHNPNRASKFVRATGQGWEIVSTDWLRLPESE
jgi:branched-chain amino acid transport system substrate-binding protein